MLEGAGGLLLQLADQRVGDVAELDQPGIGHQVEQALEEVDQRIAGHRGHRPDEEVQQGAPDVAGHHIGRPESQVDERQHGERDQRRDELLPAAVEVAEGQDGDHARDEIHHEQDHAVMAEDQQRQQGHHVHGHHHAVAHEGLQEQGDQREGEEQQEALARTDEDQRRHRPQQEDHDQVRETRILEDARIVEIDGQVQQHEDRQGDQEVADQQQRRRPEVADVGLELPLVGVQHLGDLRRHDLSFLDDQLAGVDVARGRGHGRRRLGVHQVGGLLVEEQVRNQQVIHAGRPEQGVDIGAGHGGDVRQQPGPGFGQPVHLGRGILDGALVALDIDHVGLGRGVPAAALVGHHALLVDGAHRGDDGAAQVAELQPLHSPEVAGRDLVGEFIIRDRLRRGFPPLLAHLLLGLVDREVELRIQGFVFPGAPLAVVIGELGVAGHQQHEQQESDAQRNGYAVESFLHRSAI